MQQILTGRNDLYNPTRHQLQQVTCSVNNPVMHTVYLHSLSVLITIIEVSVGSLENIYGICLQDPCCQIRTDSR
jgi:hypothetical protein